MARGRYMRTTKFWSFIEKYPWFFRYFNFRDVYRDDSNEWIGSVLAQEIPNEVEWIAIRPFNKGVLRQRESKANPDNPSGAIHKTKTHKIEEQVFFYVNWSLPDSEEKPHAHTSPLDSDQAVGDFIDGLRREHQGKVTIDAIVRMKYRHVHELRPGAQRRVGKLVKNTKTFDIYFVGAAQ
jgi:hypothetical protein